MRVILIPLFLYLLSVIFIFSSCISDLINPGSLTVLEQEGNTAGGGSGNNEANTITNRNNSVSLSFSFPITTNLPNGNYGTSSNTIITFLDKQTISISNFSINTAPDVSFYLVYGSNTSNYQTEGLNISENLSDLSNTNFTIYLTTNLFCLPYDRLILFSSNSNLLINAGVEYKNFPIKANLPNSDYGTFSNAIITFINESNITVSNFSISNAPADASFYLGYGGCPSDYRTNGLRISENLGNLNNAIFSLTVSNNLFCMPYTHLAIFSSNRNRLINSGIRYNSNSNDKSGNEEVCFPITANLPNGQYNTSSNAIVTFVNQTNITVSNFSISNAPSDASFYLGYGSCSSVYRTNSLRISENLGNLNNASLSFSLTNNLFSMPYTRLVVFSSNLNSIINGGIRYSDSSNDNINTPSGTLCFPITANLPNGGYQTSSATLITFLNERTIIVSNFTVSAPDAYFYLGYGGSASDYKSRGLEISPKYTTLNNVNLAFTLSSDLSSLPYTHLAVICKMYTVTINNGIQYK